MLLPMPCYVFSAKEQITKPFTKTDTLSDEEAFLIRRIAEFWKDGDYDIVKSQIKDFLKKYPHSTSGDLLRGLVGDIYLQEKKYETALKIYEAISDNSVKDKILLNKLQCYYELSHFSSLSKDAIAYVSKAPELFPERLDEFYFLLGEAFFHQAFETEDQELKKHFLQLAQPYYEKLKNTAYANSALFASAEIYRLLGHPKAAAEIYKELAIRFPDQKEELLFQAASMEALFDKELAIESFKILAEQNGKRTNEAKYNQMVLYFQMDQFQQALNFEPHLAHSITDDQKPFFHYVLGKSHFSLGNYPNAINHMRNFLECNLKDDALRRNALLIMMASSAQTENIALFDQTLVQFQNNFPGDKELPKAIFMYALICKEQGNIDKMQAQLELLLEKYPNFEDRESLLFEYGTLCHNQGRFKECYNAFTTYLKEFPASSRHGQSRKFLISSSLELLKQNKEGVHSQKALSAFIKDMEFALEGKNAFNDKEKAEYQLLYAKALFNLKDYQKCLKALTALETGMEKDSYFLSELFFLRAQAQYQLAPSDPETFYKIMQKAIAHNPDLLKSPAIHLQLYNAFIAHAKILSSQESSGHSLSEKQAELLDKAAEHLYAAFKEEREHLKLENRLWLANHFFNKAKKFESMNPDGESFKLACDIYRRILFSKEANTLTEISQENLFLEQEVLKFAELLDGQKKYAEKISLLKTLIEKQTASPKWNWQMKQEALFELAKTYETTGELENALETYTFLRGYDEPGISEIAKLHEAKLKFALLEDADKSEHNPIIRGILNDLKDIQIRKNPVSEPIHLTAALEYATIRSKIVDQAKQNERYIFFLNRIKEDFGSIQDPLVLDYREKMIKLPEKKLLFDHYMKYIDAELIRTQAKIKFAEKEFTKAKELNQDALAVLTELEKNSVDTYLHLRLKQSIRELHAFQ
jgi:tetratricopeptide (TPR) repeat protein